MGLITDYWTGPGEGSPTERALIGGLEPTISMWSLDELVTGELKAAEDWDGTLTLNEDSEGGLYRLRPGLVTALAAATEEQLRLWAADWARAEEFGAQEQADLPGTAAGLFSALLALQGLSRTAVEQGWSVYCTWSL